MKNMHTSVGLSGRKRSREPQGNWRKLWRKGCRKGRSKGNSVEGREEMEEEPRKQLRKVQEGQHWGKYQRKH